MDHELVMAQYRAALSMLRAAMEVCPELLWNRTSDDNPFWQIAYHTLFYAHLYLSHTEDEFAPWAKHIEGYAHMGRLPRPPHDEPTIGDPYTVDDIREYLAHIERLLPDLVLTDEFDAPSGFYWLSFTRGETHLYNIRHIQHHVGQLVERLRQTTGKGIDWIGTRP